MKEKIHQNQNLFIYIIICLVFCVRLLLVEKNSEETVKYPYVPTAKDSLKNVVVTSEEEISYSLQLKRRCNIPDSIPWGHYKIFLYEDGVKVELARLDKIINKQREILKEKLK